MDANELAVWRTTLFEALESVEATLGKLKQAIMADKDLPCWVYDTDTQCVLDNLAAREKACAVIGMLEYVDEHDTRETVTLPGVMGHSSDTLKAVNNVNQAKEAFRQVFQQVRNETVVIDVIDIRQRKREKRVSLAKHTLEKMGRGRLNVIQTYRLIKVFTERPQRIGFTWARTNKAEKVSKKHVAKMLYNLGEGDDVYAAINALSGIPETETLAYVRPPHLHVRANLVWGEAAPQQVNCSLPLFLPCNLNQPLPMGSRLEKPKAAKPRQKRVNQKLEESPFLDIVSVYRYLPQYR